MLQQARRRIGDALGRPRRWRHLEQLPKRGIGAEIGVYRGDLSVDLLRIARPTKLHLIDAWWTLTDTYESPWYETRDTREAYEIARRRVAGQPVEFHIGDSREILPTFRDAYFDWVYLDSSHTYEDTVAELEILRAKVKPNGVIIGDDWYEDPELPHTQVVPAVREFCTRHGWRLGAIDEQFDQWTILPPHGTLS